MRITIFDVAGKQVETIERSAGSNLMSIGGSLKPGAYLVRVDGVNWVESIKVIKTK